MKHTLFSLFAVSLTACQTMPDQELQPALLTNTTPIAIKEIEDIISRTINKPTLIGKDTFLKKSIVTIEGQWKKGFNKPNTDTLTVSNPSLAQFFLKMDANKRCWLQHKETEKTYLLKQANCTLAE
ncbi:MAG: hypothetical protein AAGB12_10205 [Pseudomonadota bacterium]